MIEIAAAKPQDWYAVRQISHTYGEMAADGSSVRVGQLVNNPVFVLLRVGRFLFGILPTQVVDAAVVEPSRPVTV
jgi:hypothetical protein